MSVTKAKVIKAGRHYFKVGSIVTVVQQNKKGIRAVADFGSSQVLFNGEFEIVQGNATSNR